MSCTSTTTKVAQAISLMSDVLSDEVAVAQHILYAEENDRIECADEHEELKNLANDFAGENYDGLEEVQSDLQTEVGSHDVDVNPYWGFDDDDDDDDAEDDEDDDDEKEDSDSDDNDDADKAEPTDEEKIEALISTNSELEDKIAEHEQTIQDLKNTIETALDNINTLVTAAETFRDQVEEY
jgi:TATA-binding protein-associated factor Taf7